MDRAAIFSNLDKHAYYGPSYRKLRKPELALCLEFLTAQERASNDDFVFALNRWMLDRAKPRNWAIMMDLLQAAATSERASSQNIPK